MLKSERPPMPQRYLSIRDAARYLGLTEWSLRAHLHQGRLPFVKLGARVILDIADLDRVMAQLKRREVL